MSRWVGVSAFHPCLPEEGQTDVLVEGGRGVLGSDGHDGAPGELGRPHGRYSGGAADVSLRALPTLVQSKKVGFSIHRTHEFGCGTVPFLSDSASGIDCGGLDRALGHPWFVVRVPAATPSTFKPCARKNF
jgi:hypothetical protein